MPGWFRLSFPKREVVCDVCFQAVEPGVDMCSHCGTVFGDPDREYHEVVPEEWVARQLERLRSISYAELTTLAGSLRTFEFDADDGSFRGEVRVSFG